MLMRAFHRVVLARRWLTFAVMCLSFALFGAGLCDEIRRLRRAGMPLAELAKIRLGPPE